MILNRQNTKHFVVLKFEVPIKSLKQQGILPFRVRISSSIFLPAAPMKNADVKLCFHCLYLFFVFLFEKRVLYQEGL